MRGRVFFDTNIFLYSIDASAPEKRLIARDLIAQGLIQGNARISYQIVQEWMNVALQKLNMPPSAAEEFFRQFLQPLWTTQPSPELFTQALSIRHETRWSWSDSLVVSAAALEQCGVLYSEDLQGGRQIRGVTIINPFALS